MDEKIINIAAGLEKSVDELARDIYVLAEFIEGKRNKGFSSFHIEVMARDDGRDDVKLYFLDSGSPHGGSPTLLDGILFHAEGRRKHEASGWMVRKNPHWKEVWVQRFGETDPGRRDAALAEIAAKKAAEEEAKKAKREEDRFCQGEFESFSTIQIAYRAACMDVLYQRYERRYVQQRSLEWKDSPAGYLHNVYRQQWFKMFKELSYRLKASPDPKHYRSKKAFNAAVEDFAKAGQFVERLSGAFEDHFNAKDITGYFFTPAFVAAAVESAEEPDLRVDFEHLPKDVPEKTPVRWQTDREVVKDFMRFVAENQDQSSFEYEDTRLIMETLRKMYARARGQKTGEEQSLFITAKDE